LTGNAVDAVANKGGGGGGGGSNQSGSGSAGGSGVVIIRYPDTFERAASTTGSPTIDTTGGFHIYIFNASGSITI
jgi:hypothetical protein